MSQAFPIPSPVTNAMRAGYSLFEIVIASAILLSAVAATGQAVIANVRVHESMTIRSDLDERANYYAHSFADELRGALIVTEALQNSNLVGVTEVEYYPVLGIGEDGPVFDERTTLGAVDLAGPFEPAETFEGMLEGTRLDDVADLTALNPPGFCFLRVDDEIFVLVSLQQVDRTGAMLRGHAITSVQLRQNQDWLEVVEASP